MKVFCLFFLIIVCNAAVISLRVKHTKSERRCVFAYHHLHTDNPPFNGKTIELRFSEDYNQTELDETVQLFESQGIQTESYTSCAKQKEECEQRTINHKLEDDQREARWLKLASESNLEQKCAQVYSEIDKFNANQWSWKTKKSHTDVVTTCPAYRHRDEHGELTLHENSPCADLDCLKIGKSKFGINFYKGPKGYVEPCVNKIIIFI